jgi:hypothetical protein
LYFFPENFRSDLSSDANELDDPIFIRTTGSES